MPFSYDNYRKFCNVVEERQNRKRGIAAVGFSVPNNQNVIELTFLDVVEERYERRFERNERTAGGFGSSVTSDQTVITLLDSLIKPRCPTVRFEVVEKEDNRKFKKNKPPNNTKSVRLETYSYRMASADRQFIDQELKHLHLVSRKRLEGPYRRRVFFAQKHEVIRNNTYAVEITSKNSVVWFSQRDGDIYV